MQELNIGIDLGGTKILALVADQGGNILARAKSKTDIGAGVAGIAGQMYEQASAALKVAGCNWSRVGGVGMALPTSIDPHTGEALHAPNLGWQNEPVLPVFRKIFEREVFLENDVNCGTLAEARVGAAAGISDIAGFFVGTGLGGALIIDGRLRRGTRGNAGEFGHQIIRFNGRRCGCGNRGCLEAYCSKTGFAKAFRKQILNKKCESMLTGLMNGKDFSALKSSVLKKAFKAGDTVVCEVMNKAMLMLGAGIASIITTCAVDCIVVGGGVMESLGEELMPVVRKGMEAHLFAVKPQDIQLRLSALGDDAVPLGAAILARDRGQV